MLAGAKQDFTKSAWWVAANIGHRDEKHLCSNQSQVQSIVGDLVHELILQWRALRGCSGRATETEFVTITEHRISILEYFLKDFMKLKIGLMALPEEH